MTEPGDTSVTVFQPMYGFGEDTVYLSPAPIHHAAPLRFVGTVRSVGGTVVRMESFDAEAAPAAIERYHVTHSQWVPTMFVRLLKLPADVRRRHDVSSLRCAVHAAAPCPVEVKRAMVEWWGRCSMSTTRAPRVPGSPSSTAGSGWPSPGPSGTTGWTGDPVGREVDRPSVWSDRSILRAVSVRMSTTDSQEATPCGN